MSDLEQVLAHRRARIQAASKRVGGDAELGRMLGYKSGAMVWQMSNGHRPVTERTVAKLQSLPGWARWFDVPDEAGEAPTFSRTGRLSSESLGVAHDLSELRPIVVPTTIEWDELMDRELPETFALVVKDDAMTPLLNVGNVARFATGRAPTPGRRVLVADRDGHAYIREYRVRRADHWQAVALNPAYEAMDSVADGLRVLAVMTGLDWE